ncbi:MAG: hypothetical protein AAFN92_11800, partial [Bacteroidota bacterium]
ALDQFITLAGLDPATVPDTGLPISGVYRKDDREVSATTILLPRPAIRVEGVTFQGLTTEGTTTFANYDLALTVFPTGAAVVMTVAGQEVDYLEATGRLIVDLVLIREAGAVLLVTATLGDCQETRTVDLPTDFDFQAEETDVNVLLNVRRLERQRRLEELTVAAAALAEQPAYKRAFLYVSDTGPGVEANKGLNATLTALAKLREEEPEREDFVRKTGEIVATAFLDKLAVVNADRTELTAPRLRQLAVLKRGLAALDVSVNTVFSQWNVSKLYAGLDKNRLTTIGKHLRE